MPERALLISSARRRWGRYLPTQTAKLRAGKNSYFVEGGSMKLWWFGCYDQIVWSIWVIKGLFLLLFGGCVSGTQRKYVCHPGLENGWKRAAALSYIPPHRGRIHTNWKMKKKKKKKGKRGRERTRSPRKLEQEKGKKKEMILRKVDGCIRSIERVKINKIWWYVRLYKRGWICLACIPPRKNSHGKEKRKKDWNN